MMVSTQMLYLHFDLVNVELKKTVLTWWNDWIERWLFTDEWHRYLYWRKFKKVNLAEMVWWPLCHVVWTFFFFFHFISIRVCLWSEFCSMFFSKTFLAYWDICLFFFFLSCVSGNDNLFLISLKSILCTNFGSNILQETMTITTTMSEKKSKIRTNHHQTLDIINLLLLLFNLINNNRSEKTKIIIIINKIKTSEKRKKDVGGKAKERQEIYSARKSSDHHHHHHDKRHALCVVSYCR